MLNSYYRLSSVNVVCRVELTTVTSEYYIGNGQGDWQTVTIDIGMGVNPHDVMKILMECFLVILGLS